MKFNLTSFVEGISLGYALGTVVTYLIVTNIMFNVKLHRICVVSFLFHYINKYIV